MNGRVVAQIIRNQTNNDRNTNQATLDLIADKYYNVRISIVRLTDKENDESSICALLLGLSQLQQYACMQDLHRYLS